MLAKEDFRQIVILGYFSDAMLDKVLPLIELHQYDEREAIFRGGDVAENFYMLKRGKVLLEQRISSGMTVSIDSIKPGYSFGWSSLTSGELEPYSTFTSDAICAEPCEVFSINGEALSNLLENDHSMGYLLLKRLIRVIRRRLVHRTDQFVRLITKHPDIEDLIKE